MFYNVGEGYKIIEGTAREGHKRWFQCTYSHNQKFIVQLIPEQALRAVPVQEQIKAAGGLHR